MSTSLKPRYNPLLWAQLRPGTSDSSQLAVSATPLVPENKANTSLRVVLHDTKSALEQFSDRLGNLMDGVEHAKREIEKVNNCFADGHEKLLEELNATVNRSQRGLLETLGSPAQSTVLEEVNTRQRESNRKLALLEDKAELVQRQLQAISEQQGHILTSLATITPLAPLVKDSPQQQTQILSMLTSLLPILPILQSLPAQIKASQEATITSVNKSVAEMRHSSPKLSQSHVSRPTARIDCKSPRPETDERQPCLVSNRQPCIPVPPPRRTFSSETSHSSCFPTLSVNSQIRQLADSKIPGPLRTLLVSSTSHHDQGDSSLETGRVHKRQRLTSSVETQRKEMSSRTAPGDVDTSSSSSKSSRVQSRHGTMAAKAISRCNSYRPASLYGGPARTPKKSDIVNPLPTVPDGLVDATPPDIDGMPALSALQLKRSMAIEQGRFTPDYFPSSTSPFARRGDPTKFHILPEIPIAPETPSHRNVKHVEEHVSSTGFSVRKQLVRRNSQQRRLLNEDADEDVEIDLDWGDMASN